MTHYRPAYVKPAILNLRVLGGLLAASILLGLINNFFNADGVAWLGSPPVLPKPEGWPTLSFAQGVAAGVAFAWDEILKHPLLVAGSLLALAFGLAFFRARHGGRTRFAMTWFRLAFGAMFLAAAWPKFTDPEGFAMMVAQYQMLPEFSVHLFSVWLPALEVVTGLALLFAPWERESVALLGLMMMMFIVALAQALARDLGIACGCFDIKGATDAGESWFALLRDIVLMAPIAWMFVKADVRPLWKF